MTAIEYEGDLTCAMQCKDMEASIAWYQEYLGFEVAYKLDDLGWCELKTPNGKVQVGFSQVETPEVKGGATLVWGVKDIDASRAQLEERGVRFDGDTVTIDGMVRLCTFFDPDGNKVMFSQSLQQG